MTIRRCANAGMLALACLVMLPDAANAAEKADAADGGKPATTRRDAAEVVKEGDMSQWLQYYQRERGDGWSKTPAAQPADTPAPGAKPSAAPAREAQSPAPK